jgi:hypothetical protein
LVNISGKARRKQMLSRISDNMISQIAPKDYRQKAKQNISLDNSSLNPIAERNSYEN